MVEEGNPYFELVDGMLIHNGQICYIVAQEVLKRDVVRIPASVTTISMDTISKLYGSEGQRNVVATDHPVFKAADGALYRKETNALVFLSPGVRSFELPDGYTLGRGSLFFADDLQEISVPQDLQISTNVFEPAEPDGVSPTDRRIADRAVKSITVRWPDGTSCSFPGEFVKSIRTVQKETVEVKPGTEILYLELYLAGKITAPKEKGNFLKSAFQILTILIDQNDPDRFRRVLECGGLVTSNNRTRLLKHAQELGRKEIVDLIKGAQ